MALLEIKYKRNDVVAYCPDGRHDGEFLFIESDTTTNFPGGQSTVYHGRLFRTKEYKKGKCAPIFVRNVASIEEGNLKSLEDIS